MTNTMLIQNAVMLRQETVNTAIDHEHSLIEIDTLRQVNTNLIAAYDEVLEVRRHGHAQRLQSEQELRQMENDLCRKRLEVCAAQMSPSF